MQKLAELCVHRPVFATMLIASIVVVGIVSVFQLGVDRYPRIEMPVVSVSTTNRGATPENIETEVTDRVEAAVNTVAGIDELRSTSSEGSSRVNITFDLSKNPDVAAQEAGDPEVVIWGTGEATREFLYVDDCARAVLLAAENYESDEPVNLGTGREIKIRELVEHVADVVGYRGRRVYDATKPDGQPRRCLNVSRALQCFGFRSHVTLREGIEETVRWYLESGAGARPKEIPVLSHAPA